jgi:putative hemolysin
MRILLFLFILSLVTFADDETADCKSFLQRLTPKIELVTASDNGLKFQVNNGTTLAEKFFGSAFTMSASPFWLSKMSKAIQEVAKNTKPIPIYEKLLEAFQIGYKVNGNLDSIPKTGPLVIVANHPQFGAETLSIATMISKIRPDIKIVANKMVQSIPGLKEQTIAVNVTSKDLAENIRSYLEMRKWLKSGHVLIIHPAGKVSAYQKSSGRFEDSPWGEGFIHLIESSDSPVLAVHAQGNLPGPMFNFVSAALPMGVRSTYPGEILRQKNSTIDLTLSDLVTPEVIRSFTDRASAVQFLREQTYQFEKK